MHYAQARTLAIAKKKQLTAQHPLVRAFFYATLLLLCISQPLTSYAENNDKLTDDAEDSAFLVATDQLHGTSFEQTVILLTHYSKEGATGLTINRPTDILLTEALPAIRQLKQRKDLLYLGGPVSTNAIFVLMRTLRPSNNMHRIGKDIYFSTGKHAFTSAFQETSPNGVRTYAGYAGWGAGQLQREIDRGDWLMVHTHPKIIFEKDIDSLWRRLSQRWSGKWI